MSATSDWSYESCLADLAENVPRRLPAAPRPPHGGSQRLVARLLANRMKHLGSLPYNKGRCNRPAAQDFSSATKLTPWHVTCMQHSHSWWACSRRAIPKRQSCIDSFVEHPPAAVAHKRVRFSHTAELATRCSRRCLNQACSRKQDDVTVLTYRLNSRVPTPQLHPRWCSWFVRGQELSP